jgi:hypothetical protein
VRLVTTIILLLKFCRWYVAAQPEDSVLHFRQGARCLTSDALNIALKKDGWSGPSLLDTAVTYNKARTVFMKATFGSGAETTCVGRLELTFTGKANDSGQ